MTKLKSKPNLAHSESQKQLDQAEKDFQKFDENIKEMTLDRMNKAPVKEAEPQTNISATDIQKSPDVYIKPKRAISSKEPFNEKWRESYKFSSEYVQFIAQNNEILGEAIELWTKPYPGVPAQEWRIPVNKPVWAPRFVAERIKGCKYHKLTMQQTTTTGSDGMGEYYGAMAVDSAVQRLDAIPVNQQKSVFMGAGAF